MSSLIRGGRVPRRLIIVCFTVLAAPGLFPGVATAAEDGAVPLGFSADLALWSLISFLLFLLLLVRFAFKPLIAALDQRELRIREDIAAAEQSRIKAEQMLQEHAARLDRVQEDVQAILDEARRDAEIARQNILGEAQSEIDAARQRALVEVSRAKDQALKELFDAMAVQVADATEHIVGRQLSEDDHNRLVQEALTEFSYRPV